MIDPHCEHISEGGGRPISSSHQIGRKHAPPLIVLKVTTYTPCLNKNCATTHSFTSLTNVNRFSKFFHCRILPEILSQSDRVGAKSPIFDLFALVAPNTFLSVKTVSDRVVQGILWPNYPCKNDWWGTSP